MLPRKSPLTQCDWSPDSTGCSDEKLAVHKVLTQGNAWVHGWGMTNDLIVFITASEAADRLGVDRSTLTRWVQAGRITPAYKAPGVRGAFLFDAAHVDSLRVSLADTG
jgi:excisionase family DNA binding protein